VGVAKTASKEIFCYGRNFFLTVGCVNDCRCGRYYCRRQPMSRPRETVSVQVIFDMHSHGVRLWSEWGLWRWLRWRRRGLHCRFVGSTRYTSSCYSLALCQTQTIYTRQLKDWLFFRKQYTVFLKPGSLFDVLIIAELMHSASLIGSQHIRLSHRLSVRHTLVFCRRFIVVSGMQWWCNSYDCCGNVLIFFHYPVVHHSS